MKKFAFLFLAFSSFFISQFEVFGHNWHPFPFEISYYGKRDTLNYSLTGLDSLASGWLIDGLYLDSINDTKRLRSFKYPGIDWLYESHQASSPFIGNVETTTSSDSLSIVCSGFVNSKPFMGTYDLHNFSYGALSFQQFSVLTIFGVSDSVALMTSLSDSLWLSKNFGVIRFRGKNGLSGIVEMVEIKLVGVKDLEIGWQDQTFRLKLPQPGDEIHLWKQEVGTIICNGPNGSSTTNHFINQHLRIKVLSADNQTVFANVIESSPGASTGITYDTHFPYYSNDGSSFVNSMLQDSVLPTGTTVNFNSNRVSYLSFLDGLGQTHRLSFNIAIDLPDVNVFLYCARMPLSNNTMLGDWSMWCSGGIKAISFPMYVHIQGGCDMGTPLPPVQITGVSKNYSKASIRVLPQPTSEYFSFEGLNEGEFELFDAFGKKTLKGTITDKPISLAPLPQGMYFWTATHNGKPVANGKLMKD